MPTHLQTAHIDDDGVQIPAMLIPMGKPSLADQLREEFCRTRRNLRSTYHYYVCGYRIYYVEIIACET